MAVGAEGAEVQDALAVAQLPRAVELDARGVLARAAVDRAAAVVGPDVVLAGAALDDRRAVAGIEPVVARAAVEDVLLVRVVVGRVPVAPQDVVARAAEEAVRAVVAEQLVVGGAADLLAPAAVEHLPEDPGHRGPPVVRRPCRRRRRSCGRCPGRTARRAGSARTGPGVEPRWPGTRALAAAGRRDDERLRRRRLRAVDGVGHADGDLRRARLIEDRAARPRTGPRSRGPRAAAERSRAGRRAGSRRASCACPSRPRPSRR